MSANKLALIILGVGATIAGGLIMYRDIQLPNDVVAAVCRDGTYIFRKLDGTYRLRNGYAVVGPEACK